MCLEKTKKNVDTILELLRAFLTGKNLALT